jgi:hypothetical protein
VRAMSITLGTARKEKYVGRSGYDKDTWLSMQYVASVLPFLFTLLLFQDTCLLFRSPTSSRVTLCEYVVKVCCGECSSRGQVRRDE